MKTIRRDIGRIGKMVWYLCGTILVLSLPTFSYLIPTVSVVMKPAITRPAPVLESVSAERSSRVSRGDFEPIASHVSSFVSSPAARPEGRSSVPIQPSRFTASAGRVPEAGGLYRPESGPSAPAPAVAPGPVASHVSRQIRPNSALSAQNWSSAYPQDLNNFEQRYQTAMGQLFPDYGPGYGGYGGNPFDEPSGEDKNTNGDSGNNGNNGNNGNDNGDNGNNGNDNPPPPPPPPPPPDDDVTPPVNRYSFLVIGQFEGLDTRTRAFRAYQDEDGQFILENSFKVNAVPAMVGNTRGLTLGPDQQIVIDDFDADGKQDLLLSRRVPSVGTELMLYLHDNSGGYVQEAAGSFLWSTIASMGFFDFNKDDKLEVVVLFNGASNLFIYTVEDGEFKYLKEIVLPFEPSMVVDSVLEGFPRERRFYIFDSSFYRVATLTSRNPGVFLTGLVAAQSFKNFTLDGEEDGPGETDLKVFEDSGGIALAEKRGGGWVVLGRFSTTVRYPVVVFGDYVKTGARQLFCLP